MTREEQIFAEIEDIVIANIKLEGIRANSCEKYITRAIHRYAKKLCETLWDDLQKLERKYGNDNT